MKRPEECIMKKVRQRNEFDENDKTHDEELISMGPYELFADVCGWELGDGSWGQQMIIWMEACGLKVDVAE